MSTTFNFSCTKSARCKFGFFFAFSLKFVNEEILLVFVAMRREKKRKAKANLKIFHWVPVVFDKDDSVCTRQIQTQTSDVRRQQQHIDCRVVVETGKERRTTMYHFNSNH